MADPPWSDLGADTKENLQNRLTRQRFSRKTESLHFFSDGFNPAYRLLKRDHVVNGVLFCFLSEENSYPLPRTYEYQSHQPCSIILGDALTKTGVLMNRCLGCFLYFAAKLQNISPESKF